MKAWGMAVALVLVAGCSSSPGGTTSSGGSTTGGGGTTGGGSSTGGSTGGMCGMGLTACGGNCCISSTQTCLNNSCCTNTHVCGTSCCGPSTGCVADAGVCCPDTNLCGNATSCCTSSQTCVGEACCANADVCGTNACCTTGQICVDDGTGNKVCTIPCTDSTQCDSAHPCCTPLAPLSGCTSSSNCPSACLPNIGLQCRCSTATQCPSGCCAPSTGSSGHPVGPYVCKPMDGAAYNCCTSTTMSCSDMNVSCCAADATAGDLWCSLPCANDTPCGTGHCHMVMGGICGMNGFCGP